MGEYVLSWLAGWGGSLGMLPGVLMGLSCYLPWALLTAIVFDVQRRAPLGRAGSPRSLLVLTAVSIPVVYAAWGMTIAVAGMMSWAGDSRP